MMFTGSSIYPEMDTTIAPYNQIEKSENKLHLLLANITSEKLDEEQLEVAQMIHTKSLDYGLDSYKTLKVGYCESQFRREAKNPSSSATGVYQWIDSSWQFYGEQVYGHTLLSRDRLNPEDNIELALTIISDKGYVDWTASANCWT